MDNEGTGLKKQKGNFAKGENGESGGEYPETKRCHGLLRARDLDVDSGKRHISGVMGDGGWDPSQGVRGEGC
jgi:hypothetical protein